MYNSPFRPLLLTFCCNSPFRHLLLTFCLSLMTRVGLLFVFFQPDTQKGRKILCEFQGQRKYTVAFEKSNSKIIKLWYQVFSCTMISGSCSNIRPGSVNLKRRVFFGRRYSTGCDIWEKKVSKNFWSFWSFLLFACTVEEEKQNVNFWNDKSSKMFFIVLNSMLYFNLST